MLQPTPKSIPQKAPDGPKALVAELMSVNDHNSDDENANGKTADPSEEDEAKSYNKYVKREYWKLKGLETSI